MPLREVALERGLHGVILRAEGEAPSWGYYSAALRPLGDGSPDAAGVLSFELVATPPQPSEPVGAARSRQLDGRHLRADDHREQAEGLPGERDRRGRGPCRCARVRNCRDILTIG